MKKIVIISLAAVFILSGCKGKDEDKNSGKKECDKKGSDWIWNVTEKKCEEAVATKEDCYKKGASWTWDEAGKKCNQVTAGLSDKEKCEAKGAGWTWDETNKQCSEAGPSYMTVAIPSESDNNFQVVKGHHFNDQFGDRRYFKYLHFHWSDFQAPKYDSNPGECVKIHKSNLPWLVVGIGYSYISARGKGAEDICYNSEHRGQSSIYADIPICVIGNYKLAQRSDGKAVLKPSSDAVDVDSCKEYLRN